MYDLTVVGFHAWMGDTLGAFVVRPCDIHASLTYNPSRVLFFLFAKKAPSHHEHTYINK